MKHTVLFFIAALFIFSGLQNELYAQAGVRVGLKGGLNFANLNVNNSAGETYDSRTGYHVGAFATVKVSKLAIQPELIYSVQGSNYSVEVADIENVRQDFSYLNIPVLLKLYLVGGLNLQVGPQFGFLLGAKSEKDIVEEYENVNDLKELYKNSDVSLGLGAGVDLPFGLTVDARYNLGLSDVSDFEGSEKEAKNQVFQVSVGYRLFELGK